MKLNTFFAQKAKMFQRPLKHRTVRPVGRAVFVKDAESFQHLKVLSDGAAEMPFAMKSGDRVIFDFGDHCVGYLHFALRQAPNSAIVDSPVKLRFTFGEFPLEIETPPEDYEGWLGSGWLQNETKNIVFTPYSAFLERRYTFRYLRIERIDSAPYTIQLEDLFADCVSAVDLADAPKCDLDDPVLSKIYEMSLKTLKDCQQDVFEDGPKRDRRLWIGDLRLQALTDYVTFQNADLVKRCLYLFAAYRTDGGFVAPCLFQNSPPYVDEMVYIDYSLFFISCLYDYVQFSGDREILQDLYLTAKEQAILAYGLLDKTAGSIPQEPFIDWCPGLDKSLSTLGVFVYSLRQLVVLAQQMGEDTAWITDLIKEVTLIANRFFDRQKGMFVTASGQLSWHSQLWAILSGIVSGDEAKQLLRTTMEVNPELIPHTPYMMHCYLEALDTCGMRQTALEVMKDFWGKIVQTGLDCCPEVFNPSDQFESPYNAPELNSACHAWSCTPAYWIRKYFFEE